MAATLESVSAALVALLSSIPEIGEVRDYPSSDYGKFPSVSVYLSGNDNEILDTASNEVGYRFTIRVVDPIKEDPATAEARMRKLADILVDKFNKSDDLGGLVNFLNPVSIKGGFAEGETGPLRVLEIDILARCALSI